MGEFSRAEAADRAGLEAAYLDHLIGLGLITPDSDDRLVKTDVRKAQMLRTLADAGI